MLEVGKAQFLSQRDIKVCRSGHTWRGCLSAFLSTCSDFVPSFSVSPSFTLCLYFTPHIPCWLTCVSLMSLTLSLLLCLTAPFRSTLKPETKWRSLHTLLHIFLSFISCASLSFLLQSYFFFCLFHISCQLVVALGVSVFCWSVTSSPLRLPPFLSCLFLPLTPADSLSL